jgi:hypothetical protein
MEEQQVGWIAAIIIGGIRLARRAVHEKPNGACDKHCTSTTLADLLTPLLAANPFSTMRASLRR